MTIDIYPAYKLGNNIEHADNFDDASTLNIANGNFYSMVTAMGLDWVVTEIPGTMNVTTMETALSISPRNNYTDRLTRICAIARIKRVHLIAYA